MFKIKCSLFYKAIIILENLNAFLEYVFHIHLARSQERGTISHKHEEDSFCSCSICSAVQRSFPAKTDRKALLLLAAETQITKKLASCWKNKLNGTLSSFVFFMTLYFGTTMLLMPAELKEITLMTHWKRPIWMIRILHNIFMGYLQIIQLLIHKLKSKRHVY